MPSRHASHERLHALDALRGGALMLGVVLHAALSFVPGDQYWMVRDASPSDVVSAVFFAIHVFRMTLFFVLAGFFARMSFHRLGARLFAVDRLKRIVLPLVVGWVVLIPGLLAIARLAMVHSYGPAVLATPLATPPVFSLRMLPLQHLWFLYLLSFLYVLALVGSWLANRVDPRFVLGRVVHRVVRRLVQSPLAPVVMAVPATLALVLVVGWTPWTGVPAPDRGLIPNPAALAVYGVAFLFGWAMHRQVDLLGVWKRWWWANLLLALVLTAACLQMAGADPGRAHAPQGLAKLGQAYAYALAGWTWTFALIGLSLRFLSGHSPVRRYLADASYWIYLVHMPLVVALQGAISHLDWPAELKLVFILGLAMPVMLISYQLLVRNTFIGAVLNGRRISARPSAAAPAHAPLPGIKPV